MCKLLFFFFENINHRNFHQFQMDHFQFAVVLAFVFIVPSNYIDAFPPSRTRNKVAVPCTNIPPGFDKLLLGVDVTKLDLTPIESGHDQGYRNALFDVTCNQNTWWTDTLMNNVAYQLPDAISDAYVDSRGYLDTSSDSFQSCFDYRMQETNSWTVSWSSGHWWNRCDHTDSYTYVHTEQIQQNFSQYFTRVRAEVSAQVGQLHPYWALPINNDVESYVEDMLPENYTSNPQAYSDFIAQYGTHYIDSGSLGGVFTSTFTYSEYFRNQTDESFLYKNSESSFYWSVEASGGIVNHDTHVDEVFKENTNFTVTYYGGNPKLIENRNFSSWWNTVPQTPHITHVKLNPLWLLLYKSPAKQENLKLATIDYGDHVVLRDMDRSLRSYTGKANGNQKLAQQLLTQVQQLLSTTAPALLNHDTIVDLNTKVESLLKA